MTRVLATVDHGPVTGSVIDVARALAELLGADVDIVSVEPAGRDASPAEDRAIRRVTGDVLDQLDEAISAADLAAVVVGLRAFHGGPHPAGHVALHVIERCTRPVVAVPPEVPMKARRLSCLLVPVEGGRPPSPDLVALVDLVVAAGRDVIGVHVLDRTTTPPFADRWDDAALWAEQFWQRHAPMLAGGQVHAGDVATEVLGAAERHGADTIVLEWSQRLDRHHARIVQDVLSRSTVPVLLIVDRRPAGRPSPWAEPQDGEVAWLVE